MIFKISRALTSDLHYKLARMIMSVLKETLAAAAKQIQSVFFAFLARYEIIVLHDRMGQLVKKSQLELRLYNSD